MRNRIASLALALSLGVAGAIAGQTGAYASTVPIAPSAVPTLVQSAGVGDCFDNHLCLWQHSGYSGTLGMYPRYTAGQCYNMTAMNNAASSIKNNTNRSVRMYDGAHCTGEFITYMAFEQLSNLNWDGMNDSYSSFKFL